MPKLILDLTLTQLGHLEDHLPRCKCGSGPLISNAGSPTITLKRGELYCIATGNVVLRSAKEITLATVADHPYNLHEEERTAKADREERKARDKARYTELMKEARS